MAKAVKPSEAAVVRGPKADDVKRAIAEASRHKSQAAEYSGMHGQVVKAFVDRWGIDRKAFTWARGLNDMEEDKRQSTIRSFLDLIRKLGFLDQKDLFDDTATQVAEAEAVVNGTAPAAAPAPAAQTTGEVVSLATAAKASMKKADKAVKTAADRAEATSKEKAELLARKSREDVDAAPEEVAKPYSQRLAEANKVVDDEIRDRGKASKDRIADEINDAIGVH